MIYKHNQEFVKWREGMRDSVNGYTERDAFEAGQQSKQAKIDELQNKLDEQNKVIDEVFKIIHNSYMSYENENLETVYDKVKELLK